VNTVRGIGEIFEFLADVDDVPEWINLYSPIYYVASVVNGVSDNMVFKEEYSIFVERAAREIVAEKSEELKKRKKKSRIS
jgi:hypothetical protein